MSVTKVMFKDKDGFHYKHPERSCERCMKYPCLKDMSNLKGNFARYGCIDYEDMNTFNVWKPKR